MDIDDAATIGRRLRLARKTRGKALVVIAGLAGMSKSKLDRIERGEIALDRLSEIVALANALEISPGDLMRSSATGCASRALPWICGGKMTSR